MVSIGHANSRRYYDLVQNYCGSVPHCCRSAQDYSGSHLRHCCGSARDCFGSRLRCCEVLRRATLCHSDDSKVLAPQVHSVHVPEMRCDWAGHWTIRPVAAVTDLHYARSNEE